MTNSKLVSVKNFPGIYRVLVKDTSNEKWIEPKRGAQFVASRYERGADGKKKKVKRYFKAFAEAKAYRAGQTKLAAMNQTALEKPLDGMRFGELVEKWKSDWLPNKDVSTQIRYRSYLQHLNFFNDLIVDAIDPSTVDQWIAHIKKPEYLAMCNATRCSCNHEFSVLRGILNFYISRFNRNYRLPFIKDHKKALKIKEKMKITKDLTIEEVKAFKKALQEVCVETKSEPIYYLALMQYATYTRVQEAAALHYEDFDFERKKLFVKRKIQWLRSRGYEDRIVDGTKTDGGKIIPIPELAVRVFREWVMKSGVRSGLLFRIDGNLITYRQIEHRYTQALKRAGLPFTATHLLRHASLTEFHDIEGNIGATQKVAGHRDIRATMKYAKVRDEKVAQTQLKMDAKLESLSL